MFTDFQKLTLTLTALLVTLCPSLAHADESVAGWLSVERGPGAETCPAASSLQTATEALVEHTPHVAQPVLYVRFERRAGVFSAKLRRVDEGSAARTLSDARADCATLAQAVSTVLVSMLETQTTDEPPAAERNPPAAPAPVPVPVSELEDEPAPATKPASRNSLGLVAQAGAAFGIVNQVSPVLEGQLVLGSGGFRASLGGLWLPAQENELGPGHVDATLLAATTRACLRLLNFSSLNVFGCTGLFGGALRASAHGYTTDFTESRPWLALPLELGLGGSMFESASYGLGWRAGASLVLPARRETFSVRGLGTAVEPERVGAMLWFSLENALLW